MSARSARGMKKHGGCWNGKDSVSGWILKGSTGKTGQACGRSLIQSHWRCWDQLAELE